MHSRLTEVLSGMCFVIFSGFHFLKTGQTDDILHRTDLFTFGVIPFSPQSPNETVKPTTLQILTAVDY
jgi:hypothetical protein